MLLAVSTSQKFMVAAVPRSPHQKKTASAYATPA
jgi:hypothetical protein